MPRWPFWSTVRGGSTRFGPLDPLARYVSRANAAPHGSGRVNGNRLHPKTPRGTAAALGRGARRGNDERRSVLQANAVRLEVLGAARAPHGQGLLAELAEGGAGAGGAVPVE